MSKIHVSPEKQLEELMLGVDEVISKEELLEQLKNSYTTQKPLNIKLGADPSRPDIHLGHTVVLNKLRTLQNFGHHVTFIIGDFTAMIGDPTGRNKTRPALGLEEIKKNAITYKEQVFKILDPKKTTVVFNSTWLEKLTPMDFVKLLASRTVQQLLARDDFSKRYEKNVPIFLHEFVYPILQAYDSVEIKADIEVGGTDQKFNLLVGRELQKQKGQKGQSLIIFPLLEGLDGVQKMSKSLDNYIGITDSPEQIFGKIMSISDPLMIKYYRLLSRKGKDTIDALLKDLEKEALHPMEAKKNLAEEITGHYWGEDQAQEARKNFEAVFSNKKLPEDIKEHVIKIGKENKINLLNISMEVGFSQSKSEARRILKQNGIKIDGKTHKEEWLVVEKNKSYIFKQGKLKIVKLVIE